MCVVPARGARRRRAAPRRRWGTRLLPDLLSVEAVGVQLRQGLAQWHPAGGGVQRAVQRLRGAAA
jgi:hypothetical protein